MDVWPEARAEAQNPPTGVALPWWPKLSELMGGLRPNELTLLCAPTGAGKTTLLANISTQLLLHKVPHFAAPVETGDCDYALRVAGAIEQREFNDGNAVPTESIVKAERVLTEWAGRTPFNIATYSDRVAAEDMENMLLYQHSTYGVKVALLDNLNFFLKVGKAQDAIQEMDETVHKFVMLRKRIPIHIILVVHPKKTDGGRVESEFDIKGSSTAVQECNNILLFNRPKPEDVERKWRNWHDRELVFKKLRKRGYNVNRPVWLNYSGGQYREVKPKDPPKSGTAPYL